MRARLGVVAVAATLALALAGQAMAVTISFLQTDTRKVVDQRLTFVGIAAHVTGVRCQTETSTSFFCIVAISGGYGTADYNVAVRGDQLSWNLSR